MPQKKQESRNGYHLELYDKEPDLDLSINDVVSLAIYRSKFHKEINDLENSIDRQANIATIMNSYKLPISSILVQLHPNDFQSKVFPKLTKQPNDKIELDQWSFFSYLLVSLRTDETQRKFVQIESQVFNSRMKNFLNGINNQPNKVFILPEPLNSITPINIMNYFDKNTQEFSFPFYEIFPFINVVTCKLQNGKVAVKLVDLDSFLTSLFTMYLNKKIASYRAKKIHESSLVKVLIRLFDEETGNFQVKQRKDYSKVMLDEIPTVSRSFPPCMRNMYETLKRNHKLKHLGRLHFGLFVKGIGLTMDESLKFWRTEMLKAITSDEFDKQYAYNIRYNYGKEGSCKNRLPYTCAGISREGAPASGEAHGCPFKYMSPPQLEDLMKLINPQITQSTMNIILEKARMNPGIACATCFNGLHPKHEFDETGVSHPNVYFSESEERFREEEKDASAEPQE